MTDPAFSEDPPKTGDTLPGVAAGIDGIFKVLYDMRGEIREVRKELHDMREDHGARIARLERRADEYERRLASLEKPAD